MILDLDSYVRHEDSKEELLHLGHNWFVHNRRHRSVRAWYEAIPAKHASLSTAENDQRQVVSTLLKLDGAEAAVVPCLFRRSSLRQGPLRTSLEVDVSRDDDDFMVVLHITLPDIEILRDVPLVRTRISVHIYIGNPLLSTTDLKAYNAARMSVPQRVEMGDPLFCVSTGRAMVFSAYLHSPKDDALFGLSVGQAAQADPHFTLHRSLTKNRHGQDRHQLAFQCLGTTLSSPSHTLVENTIQGFEACTQDATLNNDRSKEFRLSQRMEEIAKLRTALTRPQELTVGHACAAELSIRPCIETHTLSAPPGSVRTPAHPTKPVRLFTHTHLLSWTLFRIPSSPRTSDNPITLHAYPIPITAGAPVSFHVADPHHERPLGPLRDGVMNGTPASVVVRGQVAREWAVFPAATRRGLRVAARGDAGVLVVAVDANGDESEERMRAVGILYAVPERGPYGLVEPLSTVLKRIRSVAGLELRLQGKWWREQYK